MCELKDKTYYKFQRLDKFERIIEIILNKKLYGAVYKELNDPMEGKFNREGLVKDDFKEIYGQLETTRICSLMTKQEGKQDFPDNFLMWSHYADSHKGCCFELQITGDYNKDWKLTKIDYQNQLPIVKGSVDEKIIHILSVKDPIWKDEHEVRAIRIYNKSNFKDLSAFYHIKIKAIYFGKRVNKEKCQFYKKLISKIDSNIELYKIIEEKKNTGFFPKLTYKEL